MIGRFRCAMAYAVIYDGNCNLCVSWVRLLEQLERGQQFVYVPMQDSQRLSGWEIEPIDCNAGMIFLNLADRSQRWQGSAAAEAIAEQFPLGKPLVALYRGLPGLKVVGDSAYCQIRDNRYDWFGGRSETYWSSHRGDLDTCETGNCSF
jgi:predicted DCC family thiol-disulfide oxidoreductase YuxK